MKAHLFSLGGTALAGSPADYGKLIAEETEKRGKVVRAAASKPGWPRPVQVRIRQRQDDLLFFIVTDWQQTFA